MMPQQGWMNRLLNGCQRLPGWPPGWVGSGRLLLTAVLLLLLLDFVSVAAVTTGYGKIWSKGRTWCLTVAGVVLSPALTLPTSSCWRALPRGPHKLFAEWLITFTFISPWEEQVCRLRVLTASTFWFGGLVILDRYSQEIDSIFPIQHAQKAFTLLDVTWLP